MRALLNSIETLETRQFFADLAFDPAFSDNGIYRSDGLGSVVLMAGDRAVTVRGDVTVTAVSDRGRRIGAHTALLPDSDSQFTATVADDGTIVVAATHASLNGAVRVWRFLGDGFTRDTTFGAVATIARSAGLC